MIQTRPRFHFLFLCYSLLFQSLLSINITLELNDNGDGEKTPTVVVGEPFKVSVSVSPGSRNTGQIQLEVGKDIQGQGTTHETKITSVNGQYQSHIINNFQLIAKSEGEYIIGPAKITHEGSTITSNTITVTAVKQRPNQEQQNNTQHLMLCHITTNKKNVFVGEPVILTVSIVSHHSVLQVSMEPPHFDQFTTKEITDAKRYEKTYNNIPYHVLEKKFILTPTNTGDLVIEPIKLTFAIQAPRKKQKKRFMDDSIFGPLESFSSYFDRDRIIQKNTSSNELILHVDPLPQTEVQPEHIGTITSFKAHVDKQQTCINQAIQFSLELEGTGNIDLIPTPKLHLPPYTKSYESKNNIIPDKNNMLGGKKIFEYVMQVGVEGETEVPAQAFTFFDPTTETTKTIYTDPIHLTIEPAPVFHQPSAPPKDQEISQPKTQPTPQATMQSDQPPAPIQHDVCFIQEDGPISQSKTLSLSWTLFFLMMLLIPFLSGGRSWITSTTEKLFKLQGNRHHIQRKVDGLIKTFALYEKQGNLKKLYQLFIDIIALKNEISTEQITHEWLYNYLATQAWEEKKINDFFDFLNECARFRFASETTVQEAEKIIFFQKASYWLMLLNK